MDCLFCHFNTDIINNKFNPPNTKTYFISKDDYTEYINNIISKNYDINNINDIFPIFHNESYSIKAKNIKDVSNRNSTIKKERGPLHKEVIFISKDYPDIKYPNLDINCYSLKNPSNLKNEIILLRIRNKCFDNAEKKRKSSYNSENDSNSIKNKDCMSTNDKESFLSDESSDISKKVTLIVSHSASDDLGIIFPRLCDLASLLKCDVISYDYTGYGCSNLKPNYNSLKKDLIIVLNFCNNTLDLKNENIVLLSFNIGAIPSIYASSQPKYCSIRGIILVSPSFNFIKKFDFEIINEVICPVFLIQGNYEDTIEKKKNIEFSKNFNESIYWISKNGRNYDEIIDENRYKFYQKIRKFLSHVQTSRIKISQTIAESKNSTVILDN